MRMIRLKKYYSIPQYNNDPVAGSRSLLLPNLQELSDKVIMQTNNTQIEGSFMSIF